MIAFLKPQTALWDEIYGGSHWAGLLRAAPEERERESLGGEPHHAKGVEKIWSQAVVHKITVARRYYSSALCLLFMVAYQLCFQTQKLWTSKT